MVFHIISLGLGDERDITVRGLETVKQCERLYLEAYTAILGVDVSRLVRNNPYHPHGRIHGG